MSELFVYRSDAFEPILRRLGFFIGKYIYLLDAYLDREEDRKKGNFNPLLVSEQPRGGETIDEWMPRVLDDTMREAVIEFEKLPLERDLPILRNIVYEGVRIQLMKDLQKMEEREKNDE